MKNVLKLATCLVVLLFSQCDKADFEAARTEGEVEKEPVFSETSKQFGEAVAIELKGAVINLNKQGVNYLNANETDEFKKKFYEDYFKASPSLAKTRSSVEAVNNSLPTAKEFAERVKNLTCDQREFIDNIVSECKKSSSYSDFFKRLNRLNEKIYGEIPEIQQERLLNITAVLYYGMKEMKTLEEQGLMPVTRQNAMRQLTIKTRAEDGGSFGSSCRSFLATVWTIAVGEPTPIGEIVASVASVLVGAVWLYEVVVCIKNSSSSSGGYCYDRFEYCYSPILDGCSVCLQYCLTHGTWPPYSTHKCS